LNYILEIREFYDWLEVNPMNASDIALWHALMAINNKTRWSRDFSTTISTLESKTGMRRSSIYNSRNKLKQAERIDYKERKGRLSTIYRMIPFVSVTQTQNGENEVCVCHTDTKQDTTWTQSGTQLGHKPGTLNKLKQKQNINENKKEIYVVDGDAAGADVRNEAGKLLTPEILFSECFQKEPAPFESKRCDQLLHLHDPDLVEYAFERSAEMGQKTLAYVQGILNRMAQRGIHDMGDLADWDMKAGDI